MNKANQIKKRLLKVENDIVRANKLFCANYDIEWTRNHDICLRNAMREFFTAGVYPVVAELFGFDKIDLKNAKDKT